MTGEDHKLAAIVFTDIVGYTKQMEENEQRTMQLLQRQREIIFPLVESYGGSVIKEIGDGLMMMFGSAVEAVRFAISVQKRLIDEELTIRAGIHIGDVIFRDGDVFGSAVNTAARIEPLAPPNGICISEDVRTQLQNKSDILTIPVGKKELKGVKAPVAIYEVFIEGVSLHQEFNIKYFIRDLWNRAVIQILAGYILSAWIIKMAVSSMVTEFMLSPYLIDLTWVILLSLLPSVFLLTYFHAKRKSFGWNRIELVGMPVNLVITIILAIFLFEGKDLGATTTTLTVQNEAGENITRTVLKKEFRKKVAIFFFDNKSGDQNYNWLQYGLSRILNYDMAQNQLIETVSAFSFNDKFANVGFADGLNVPLMLKQKIAAYYHNNYFTTGSFNHQNNKWEIELKIYETGNGKLLKQLNESDADLFNLVDKISLDVKKNLDISDSQLDESTDFAVAEIFTGSMKAFENFTKSMVQITFHNNWEEGLKYAENAVESDPDFAIAHLTMAEYYFNNNQPAQAETALNITMEKDKIIKLPERKQFYAKFFYYLMQQKAEQANAVVKMWTELYPEDIEARSMLSQRYLMNNNFEGALAQLKHIIRIAPENYEYTQQLGDLYELMGNYDSSIYYYKIFTDNFPKDFKAYTNLGDSYRLQSNFTEAMDNYNKALLLDPDNSAIVYKIVNLHLRNGNFNEAYDLLSSTLPRCKTATDSIRIYDSFENYHTLQGEILTSFDYFQHRFHLLESILPPMKIMVFRTFLISIYNEAGKDEEAIKLLQEIETEFEAPFDKVSAFGYLFYYIETGEPEKAETYIDRAVELINGFGEQSLLANIYYAEGRIAELKNNYEDAIKSYNKYLSLKPGEDAIYRWLSRSYRESGDLKTAVEFMDEALKKFPMHPKNFYEAALLYQKMGYLTRALEHIKKANEIWKNADPVYKPAIKAKALQQELETSV